ncbi:ABC transporter ATP-binding protein [Actinomycetaceae bacterium L2_0104]
MSTRPIQSRIPSTSGQLARWLLGVARPVLAPLVASTFFRIVGQCASIALLVTAAGAVASAAVGELSWGIGAVLWLLAGLALIKALCAYLEQYTGHLVAFKALARLRSYFYDRLEPQAPAAVQGRESGDLLARATKDIDRIETFFAHTVAPAISAVVAPLSAACWLALAIDPLSALIALVGWVLVGVVVPFAGWRTTARQAQRLRNRRGALAHHVTDSVQGTEEVLAFGIEDERLHRMSRIEDGIGALLVSHSRLLAGRRAMAALVQVATPAVVLLAGSARVTSGDLSLTALVMAVAAAGAVMPVVLAVEEFVSVLDSALAAARAVAEITEAQPAISQPDHPRALLGGRSDENHEGIVPPGIELENVTFGYPRKIDESAPPVPPLRDGSHEHTDEVAASPVLKDVSLTIEPGETVALVGASGSGKSTIGAMIARVWDPQAGSVRLGGIDVSELAEAELRRAVTLVPQRPFLFSGTVRENLLLADPEAGDEELWEACSLVALASDSASLPYGLDTVVGEFGGGVSGGQRQRIALARALLRGAPVLVLDEVTSDLDPDTEREVAGNLRLLAPERTLVFIAHRPTTALLADRVFVIDDGRIVESGRPDELAAADGPFSRLMVREG